MARQSNIIDLSILLNYFERLHKAIDGLYPKTITWENVEDYNIKLDIKHPDWVRAHFPLVMIYHKEKAGKLRDSKSISVMYQNNNNILTQLVWGADNFGMYHRKNKHKGFSNIVGAISADENDLDGFDIDRQKPKKYKNFEDFLTLYHPTDTNTKALCEVLGKNYTCDSTGQLKMF